jgi:adenylate cyclase
MRKNHWISLFLGLLVASAIALAEWRRDVYFGSPAGAGIRTSTHSFDYNLAYAMQRAEWACYDWRFKILGNRTPHPDVVILAIDETSLRDLHQWPWPRGIHARLIEKLAKAPPKALAFDVLFLEPFTLDPAGDRELVQATKRHNWVIHSYFFETEGDDVKQVHLPFPNLLGAIHRAGYVNAFIDAEGVLRSARGQMNVQDQTISLLSVEAASLYLGRPPEDILRTMPQDRRGRMYLNFVGKDYTFPYIPYVDVLTGKYPAEKLAGKVVLVGSSATGTYDHYPTPTSGVMPGVEFHANVIDNILRNSALRLAGIRWTYAWIAIFGLLGGLIIARSSAGIGALCVVFAVLGFFGGTQWLFAHRNMVVDMAGPLLALTLAYVAIVIYRFFTEEREKRMVKSFFSQQVSGDLLDALMNDPGILKRGGERREMTAFFSDVAGFTSISERLEPEELVTLLNRYLTAMTNVIFENGGYVDKYMGDGIMAFWNGVVRQTDHAERACRCALQSKRRLQELNKELEEKGLVALKARVGVNTGVMVAGYMGSAQRNNYTIMGDNVNLASRLEGANKAFGSSIMISEFTYEMIQDQFEVRFLDKIRVPGKGKPVKVFELLSEKGGLSPEWQAAHALYHEAIMLFVGREFSKAREKFLEVSRILGQDKACMTYVERAETFIAHPPAEDWDGVFEVKSK